MGKQSDVLMAYAGIMLLVLTPIYYIIRIVMDTIGIVIIDWWTLVISIGIDIFLVLKLIKIYYK